MGLQIQVSKNTNDPHWDEFVGTVPGGHHVQSAMWSQVKAINKWGVIRVIAKEQEQIIGGAQLLVRVIIPSMACIIYLTKGPIIAKDNIDVVKKIIQSVCQICRNKHSLILVVQPPNNGDLISSYLPSCGFQPSKLELAPVASLLLDLTPSLDQLISNMKRQTRQNIRRGETVGLVVREGSESDLEEFYEFHKATSHRQGFIPYSKEYYFQMWRVFKPQDCIRLFIAEYEGKRITGLLIIPFGDTVIAKILGWSGDYPDLKPNDAVFWAAIKWSKSNGYHYFDFEGIDVNGAKTMLTGAPLPNELKHSPDFFKLGYGGQVVLYPQAFEMIQNPLINWLYKKASPRVGGESLASRVMDRLRKV